MNSKISRANSEAKFGSNFGTSECNFETFLNCANPLGADHLTLEGGGGVGDFWSARIFNFSFQQSGGQDIFFPSKCSAGYFFPTSFLCRIFFSSKKGHVFTYTKCIYTYIVVIAVIVLIWSCKALKCCKLYKIIIVQLSFQKVILYTHFITSK